MTEFVTSLNTQSQALDITTPSLRASMTEFVATLNAQSQAPDDPTFPHHPEGPRASVFLVT